jgi:molybdopterin converting factor small subunit
MKCYIKYYGATKDITQIDGEEIEFSGYILTLYDVKAVAEQNYPGLRNIAFSLAVNRNIMDSNIELNDKDEIALLPPFAGG